MVKMLRNKILLKIFILFVTLVILLNSKKLYILRKEVTRDQEAVFPQGRKNKILSLKSIDFYSYKVHKRVTVTANLLNWIPWAILCVY